MDPPEGFDPNQGYWQDQEGHWYPLPAFQHEGSESANTGPSEGTPATPAGPPRPRPVVRPMGTLGPAPFQVPPHVPYYHPYPHSPYTPQAPTSSTNHTPPTLSTASLDPPPLPLARPSGAAAPTPAAPVPESSGTPASSAAKGKKRAADADADAATKKPKAAAPKASAKGKGKQIAGKATKAKSGDTVKSGRAPGSFNYNDADLEALLDVVEGLLPIGMNSWTQVMNDFNQWAAENGRPNRTQKPLKTKFEALARTPKPTGSAEVPPHVERAYEIEQLINERAATRDLDDDDIADGDVDGDELAAVEDDADPEDDEVEVLDGPPAKAASAAPGPVLKTFTAASTTTSTPPPAGSRTGSSRTASSSRRAQTTEFMGAVTSSLDPIAREARDEARFARNLARDELNRLTQDNRDLRARNDALQDRLHQQSLQLQQSINEATRLQARVEMLEMMSSLTGMAGVRSRPQGHARDYDDVRGTPTRYRSYSRTYYHERSPSYSTEWRSPARRHRSSRPSPPSHRVDDADVFSAPGPSSTSALPSFASVFSSSASGLDVLADASSSSRVSDFDAVPRDEADQRPSDNIDDSF